MEKQDIKKQSFSELIKDKTPVLVDFYADWCGPCKMMTPIIKEFKKKVGDRINVIKVDVDRNTAVAAKYNIRGVPTLILFKNGKILWRQSGVIQSHQLQSIINQKLGNQ